MTPVRTDEGMPKRRRLEGKQGHSMSMEACQDVLGELQNLVPRVGKTEIDQSTSILQKLQNLFPDQVIVTAIACRGTDRTMGPLNTSQKIWLHIEKHS